MQLKQYQSELLRQLEEFLIALVATCKEQADILADLPPTVYKKVVGNLDFVKRRMATNQRRKRILFPPKRWITKSLARCLSKSSDWRW